MSTTDPVNRSVPPITLIHNLLSSSNTYIARVRHCGVVYTVEVEAERSDEHMTGLYVEPIPAFESIPTVIDTSGMALYVAAVRAITAGDTRTHALLIGVAGSLSAYALGLHRAMDDAA